MDEKQEAIRILNAIIDSDGYTFFTLEHHCHFCDADWGTYQGTNYPERHMDDCPIGQAIAFLDKLDNHRQRSVLKGSGDTR